MPGRVGMGMTTLLTLTAMFSAVRQGVPRVSYVSLLDIWMLSCMIFVFCSILEFIVVTALIRSGRKSKGDRVRMVYTHNRVPDVWGVAVRAGVQDIASAPLRRVQCLLLALAAHWISGRRVRRQQQIFSYQR